MHKSRFAAQRGAGAVQHLPIQTTDHFMVCSAKSLVRELLTTNPSKRLTASQALRHTWFTASLPSNEDLRLARRNMKRHLRQRFKVIIIIITLMLTACISSKLGFRVCGEGLDFAVSFSRWMIGCWNVCCHVWCQGYKDTSGFWLVG